jgi:succinyl-diaminopimelate desuccinylase
MSTLAQDLFTLVGIPSVSGEEQEIAGFLEARLRETAVAAGNVVVRVEDSVLLLPGPEAAAGGRPLAVLAGHIDTVPRGEAPAPSMADGRVVGRGSADMKAGLAVMLHLASSLPASEGFASRAYVFYSGEEGSAAGNALPRILAAWPQLTRAGLAILLEPTSGDLELGCNGSIHCEVSFRGRACHSARPWSGLHPLQPALPWIERILHHPIRAAEVGGVVFREVASLTRLRAGEVRNVIPGELVLNLNVRYAPDRDPAGAEDYALSLCPPPEEAESRVVDHSPAGRIDSDAPLYRHLCESTGLPRRAKQGWTDVARFTSAGVPALNWGPGNPELAHTAEEYVPLDEVDRTFRMMAAFFSGPGPARQG